MNALPSSSFTSLEKRKVPPESAKAKRAYADYEAMSDRSLAKLAQKYNKPSSYVRQLARWSEDYQWQRRLKMYEDTQLEARRKKRQDETEQMDREHALYGRVQLGRSIAWLEEHFNDPATTVSQAVALMKASYEMERLARGAATSRIEADTTMTILPKEYINISESDEGSIE